MGSDLVRLTGINSGLDTEAIIGAYTSTMTKRVQEAKNGKTLNGWKQTAWQDINSKIYGFYSKTLSATRMSSAYQKTKVTTSNSALSVVAGGNAVNGIQTAQIKELATAAYYTGSKIDMKDSSKNLNEELGIDEGSVIKFVDNKGNEKSIQLGGEKKDGSDVVVNSMDDLVNALKSSGINANFDSGNQRLFLSAKTTGTANDFHFEGDVDSLMALGLATKEQILDAKGATADVSKAADRVAGKDAKLILNNAEFTSSTNTFNINGSTYTINSMPVNKDETISVTTAPDYDGVYDVVKNIIKEYNTLVNEMTKLYNADSAKGYDPLTDEQKEAMSEKEIEDWENKIKGSLLRGDSTLNDVMMSMVKNMSQGFEVGGKTLYLADFGIATGGYFDTEENERYALHLDGDVDDALTGTKEDKLKSMIASDPESVMGFFQKLSQSLYENLYSKMGSTKLSSIYKVYNDKQLKTESTEWDEKIADLEEKLADMEDKYYKKFAAMEKALAQLSSKQTSVASMLGMG